MNAARPEICDHALIQADDVRHYLSRRLQNGDLDLYSAFLLSHEAIRIGRIGYLQSAWGHQLSISGLLGLYMHGLTATAFNVPGIISLARGWFESDMELLAENRQHFFTDRMADLKLTRDTELLETLSGMRSRYDSLPDNAGPYHVEVFPWHYADPEREVLIPDSQSEFRVPDVLDSEVEDLIAELNVGQWA